MHIEFKNAARHFGAQTVFQNLNISLEPGQRYAVLGGNGSGKSTLLKTIYGALSLSEGSVSWQYSNKELSPFEAAHRMSFAGPYFELIEELTAQEFLTYYGRFREFLPELSQANILEKAWLADAATKEIRHFSSGMKQRLKLALALFSNNAVVLLDEPTSNLDPKGMDWFQALLKENLGERSLFVGSNFSDAETFLCEEKIELKDYQ